MGRKNDSSNVGAISSVSAAAFVCVSPLLDDHDEFFNPNKPAANARGDDANLGTRTTDSLAVPSAFDGIRSRLKPRKAPGDHSRVAGDGTCGMNDVHRYDEGRVSLRKRRNTAREERKPEARDIQSRKGPPKKTSSVHHGHYLDTRVAQASGSSSILAQKKRVYAPRPYEKVFDMGGVRRARFFHNRKDAETTYLPVEEALYRLEDGAPRDGRLDLGSWGIHDADMSEVAEVALINVDAKAETGGVTSLHFDNCWRCAMQQEAFKTRELWLTDDGIENLARPFIERGSPNRLEALSLAGCGLLTNKLLSVDISGTGITDDGLQLVLGASKELRSIGLRDLPGLTDRGLAAILLCMKSRRCLQNLQLCRSLRFTDEGLLAMLSEGSLLHSLDIHDCSQLSELCLMGLERTAFTSTQLRTLNVRGMSFADIGLGWVAQGCKLLENLDISRCSLLTDLSLEYLAKGSGPNRPSPLKVLNLAGGSFTDEGMAILLPKSGPTLESLTLDGVTNLGDVTMRSIARHCPNLTSLSMVELTRASDMSFKELGRRCPLLRLLDSSSDINMLETSHRTRVPKLTGDGIREMCVGTPSLLVLRLNGVCKITDGALEAVGTNCSLLEELCIRSCNLVTDVGIAAVARSCPRLKHLGVGGCVRVTDLSVRVLAIHAGRRLRALDVTGCHEVTDKFLEYMAEHCRGLQSLTMQGCERISDQGLTRMLKRCRNITALNVRGVPELTEDTLGVVEVYCRRLRRLNMEGIPAVTGSRVQLAGERLPFVIRDPGTRVLRPCSPACRVFNAHVQERVEWTASAIHVQRMTRGFLCRLQWKRGQQRRAWAARTLRTKLSSVMATILFRERLERRRAEHAAARVIQAGARDLFSRRVAKAELERLRKNRDAATNIQRVARGRRGRLAANSRRHIRLRTGTNWECFFTKLVRQDRAIALWRESLSILRCYVKLWRIVLLNRHLRYCRTVQRSWRYFLRKKAQRREEQAELERRAAAATVIKRGWKTYYRTKWLMRDVRLREQEFKRQGFKREYAQIELAIWWRWVRAKNLKRTVLQQLVVAREAAATIERAYRGYAAKTLVARAKRKSTMMRCRWRRFYLGIVSLPRPEDTVKIQGMTRRFLSRRKRNKAATEIQRVYRGVLVRRLFKVKLAHIYNTNAINIQRVVRGHIARRRKVLQVLEANRASRVITRAIHGYIANKAFRAAAAGKKAQSKQARLERLKREALVRQRAEAKVHSVFLMNQDRAARALQACWRQYRIRTQQQEDRLLKIEMDKRKARDRKEWKENIDEIKRKLRQRNRFCGALSALGNRFNKLTATMDPETSHRVAIDEYDSGEDYEQRPKTSKEKEEEREKQEADVMANSILNHQTNSIVQVGICDIHITVGRKEHDAFSEAQAYLKATKEDYMTFVEGDLSGKKALRVHLWIKMGQGVGVVTDVSIQRAPLNCGNSAAEMVRRKAAEETSQLLVGHDRCKLELKCKVSTRTKHPAPVVDDLVLCRRKADEADLLEKGYEPLKPQLKRLDLGKGFLFIHRKTFKKPLRMLDEAKYRLQRNTWCTRRTALLLEKYALKQEDVVDLYNIFTRTDFKKNGTMDVYSFFSEIGEVETRYGHWLLEMVGVDEAKTDITWDKYLEVVCFFSMFSRHEVLLFVFGALDPTMRGYLDEGDFHDEKKFLIAVTEHEVGIPGNYVGKAKRGFVRLARGGTELDFPQFDKLCAQFPRLAHPIYRLQTSVQKHNMGEHFWDDKKNTFIMGRRAVGVQKKGRPNKSSSIPSLLQ